MKAYLSGEGIAPHILDLGIDVGEWLASRPGSFNQRERTPGTHCIGRWVGSSAGVDAVVKRKIPSHCWDSNPRSSTTIPLSYTTPTWWLVKL
jgi:hypothetical protein